MGFSLYFAGAERLKEPLPDNCCCGLLASYVLGGQTLESFFNARPNERVFIDSGAFSVHHNNKVINIDEYINFINSQDKPDIWAQLDIIPYPVLNYETTKHSAEETWKNYVYMAERLTEEKREKLLPVYHFGEPYEAFERILNTEVCGKLPTYIGLGGGYGGNKKNCYPYYTNIFNIIKKSKNPNVKIHNFGNTVLDILEKFPFHSADSTTWLQSAVTGSIFCYKTGKPVTVSVNQKSSKHHIRHLHADKRDFILSEIEKYGNGCTLEDLETSDTHRLRYNRNYFIRWAENYKYKPLTVGIRKSLI